MSHDDFNPGVILGSSAAILSGLAALATLYLWGVNKARQKMDKISDPAARNVIPWLSPLLLPTFVILSLGFVACQWLAYDEKPWPKASTAIFMAWPALVILVFWLKIRKQPQDGIEDRL